ncbi:MAG: YheC/YheD family protein [Firmicutes bacterium]|uniref:YheC/D like ATP-grasp n=1 Tax=Melghirimyces thermohalophilus TaxID=1236220 RepID=A0A1G6M6H7_9BACL|nr:YheC/YheD family protein [Melghirimyces thermohalophilus]MDA8351999.1 YheC/YheD family protein [Bacillota bacterium]SDC51080.1 YheC/D like ATP-grasp [Melghirimyces thermohalophilus]
MKSQEHKVASKGLKHQVMEQHPSLRSYLPRTSWFSQESLNRWATRFPVTFLKPDQGGGGTGILRIRREGGGSFEVCDRRFCCSVLSSDLYTAVKKKMLPERRYLVQEGIQLAVIRGRPFDIRVMLQKPGGRWVISGMVAKVAAKGQFVTNRCKGGRPLTVERALEEVSIREKREVEEVLRELKQMSLLTAKVLGARFPGLRELGIDVGMDRRGHLWVFEVNTRPRFQLFRKVGQPRLYSRILQTHRRLWIGASR